MRRLLAPVLLFALVLVAAACPPHSENKSSGLPPCSKFGDTCEFSPGKLGSCVMKDGCTGDACFTCQSQH
jgi:hypothetical protein